MLLNDREYQQVPAQFVECICIGNDGNYAQLGYIEGDPVSEGEFLKHLAQLLSSANESGVRVRVFLTQKRSFELIPRELVQ